MVIGITGLPGSGKTYYATMIALQALKKGRKVYANYKIEGCQYYQNLSELTQLRDGVIIVDEINLICPSRFWNSFPPELAYFWSQTRKMQLDIYWTAQHIDRVDKVVKEITAFCWCFSRLLGLHLGKMYIPEHVGKTKAKAMGFDFFLISKKIADKYNTYEMIDIAKNILEEREGRKNGTKEIGRTAWEIKNNPNRKPTTPIPTRTNAGVVTPAPPSPSPPAHGARGNSGGVGFPFRNPEQDQDAHTRLSERETADKTFTTHNSPEAQNEPKRGTYPPKATL